MQELLLFAAIIINSGVCIFVNIIIIGIIFVMSSRCCYYSLQLQKKRTNPVGVRWMQ